MNQGIVIVINSLYNSRLIENVHVTSCDVKHSNYQQYLPSMQFSYCLFTCLANPAA